MYSNYIWILIIRDNLNSYLQNMKKKKLFGSQIKNNKIKI